MEKFETRDVQRSKNQKDSGVSRNFQGYFIYTQHFIETHLKDFPTVQISPNFGNSYLSS